jgi:beta-galactosidase
LEQDSLRLTLPAGQVQLDIVVENLGRINFGKYLLENNKGITKSVTLGGKELMGWQHYGLPLAQDPQRPGAEFKRATSDVPAISRATFTVATPTDTYLDMRQWGKGSVWVNGHNLGRYWAIGPQQTLYVPAEWLKKGQNTVTVLEVLKTRQATLSFLDHPILSELRPATTIID